ncbi:MAG: PAS domain-containing protein [Polyangiaceae bacterium]
MGPIFEPDELLAETFDQRLTRLLDRARDRLGLESLLLLELASPEGRVVPIVRAASPSVPPSCGISVAGLRALCSDSLPAADRQRVLAELGPAFVGQRVRTQPLTVSRRFAVDGDVLLIWVESGRAPEPAALAAFVTCLQRGLDEDRRARLAETLFQAVEQAADPIEITDSEARLMYANRSWEQFFRYQLNDVVGQTVGRLFRDPVAPLHDPAFYQFTLATLHAGKPWLGVLSCRSGTEERLWCEVQVSPFRADAQRLRGNFAIRRDIAHRAERDTALAVVHREFRAVLSAIPDGVVVLRDDRIYFANRAFLATVRLSEAAVIGRPYIDFIHPDDRAQFKQEHRQKVTRVRLVSPEGPPRFVEISTAGAVSFEAKPGMILLSRDTTDYRLAQEQLARAEKLSALGSLAASVAHEINNPLAYVVVNLELARGRLSEDLPSAERESLAEAIDGVRRIRRNRGGAARLLWLRRPRPHRANRRAQGAHLGAEHRAKRESGTALVWSARTKLHCTCWRAKVSWCRCS